MSTLRRFTPLRSASARLRSATRIEDPAACRWCPRPATAGGYCGVCGCKAADQLLARIVRERDRRCCRCGTEYGLTMAHIIPRGRSPRLRWERSNVVSACWPCHEDLDLHPEAKHEFFEARSPGIHERLLQIERYGPRVRLDAVLVDLAAG